MPKTYSEVYAARLWAAHNRSVFSLEPFSSPQVRWKDAKYVPNLENWMNLFKLEVEYAHAKITHEKLDMLFGDSLLFWLPQERYPVQRQLLNFAVAGSKSSKLAGVVQLTKPLMPSRIFILVGINDFLFPDDSDLEGGKDAGYEKISAKILNNLSTAFTLLRKIHPKVDLFLLSILPTRGDKVPNRIVQGHNQKMHQFAEDRQVKFLDINSYFCANQGPGKGLSLAENLTIDGIHLNSFGYQVFSAALHQELHALCR